MQEIPKSPEEMEIKPEEILTPEQKMETGISRLKLEKPEERPWANRITENLPEEYWKEAYEQVVKKWEDHASFIFEKTPEMIEKLEKHKEFKTAIIKNTKTVVRNEVLSEFKKVLQTDIESMQAEHLLVNEIDPLGHEGLGNEMQVRRKLIELGLELGILEQDPGEMLPEEKIKSYIDNYSSLFFEGERGQEREKNLDDYRAVLLKGYAIAADAFKKGYPPGTTNYPARVLETMAVYSCDLEEIYAGKPAKEIVSEKKLPELNLDALITTHGIEIGKRLDKYFKG